MPPVGSVSKNPATTPSIFSFAIVLVVARGSAGYDHVKCLYQHAVSKKVPKATIVGLSDNNNLNKRQVHVLKPLKEHNKLLIILVDDKQDGGRRPLKFKARFSNLCFVTGTSVEIDGLEDKPRLNGKMGCILSWNQDKGRYAVSVAALEDGSTFRGLFKPENLLVEFF